MWPFKKKVVQHKEVVVPEESKTEEHSIFTFEVTIKSIYDKSINIKFNVTNSHVSFEEASLSIIESAYSGARWGSLSHAMPTLKDTNDLYLELKLVEDSPKEKNKTKRRKPRK